MGPDGLRVTCTCGTILHLHLTCGTRWLACHVYLWDPMAHVSRVPVGPFSISIRPMGPNGLRVTCTYGTIHLVGLNGSHVTCTYGTILHLHPTCGTRRIACHLYLLCRRGLINSKKSPQCLGVEPRAQRKECKVFTIALDAWLY